MTYQSYSRNIRLIFIVLGSLFFLQQFGKVLFEKQRLIVVFLYFAIRIVTLYLLIFSVYALLSKIIILRKLESPVVLIIIAVVLVVSSYGPPIIFYIMSRNTDYVFTNSRLDAAEIINKSMSLNVYSEERFQLARNYYLDTGTRLPYLDDNNRETIYAPDDTAFKLYKATTKLKIAKTNLKNTALSLISIFVVSGIYFAIFLWFRFPQKQV